MKGDPKIIAHLNKVLANELIAINQYFLHARIYDDWGLKALGHKEYHESIDEMKHADELVKARAVSRRAAQFAGSGQAAHRRDRRRDVALRPLAGDGCHTQTSR